MIAASRVLLYMGLRNVPVEIHHNVIKAYPIILIGLIGRGVSTILIVAKLLGFQELSLDRLVLADHSHDPLGEGTSLVLTV